MGTVPVLVGIGVRISSSDRGCGRIRPGIGVPGVLGDSALPVRAVRMVRVRTIGVTVQSAAVRGGDVAGVAGSGSMVVPCFPMLRVLAGPERTLIRRCGGRRRRMRAMRMLVTAGRRMVRVAVPSDRSRCMRMGRVRRGCVSGAAARIPRSQTMLVMAVLVLPSGIHPGRVSGMFGLARMIRVLVPRMDVRHVRRRHRSVRRGLVRERFVLIGARAGGRCDPEKQDRSDLSNH